jgi:hypothetical protein
MRLWTIRSEKAWRSAQKGFSGEFFIWNSADAEWSFQTAYHWMAKQMRERLRIPTRRLITFPVWAWVKRPDLRWERHNYHGRQVLIEFEEDAKNVLLSDFDNWHFVLNSYYLGTQKDTNTYERDLKKAGLRFRRFEQLPWDFRIRVEKSWEAGVFKIRKKSTVQATLWEIPLKNIKKVVPFVGTLPKSKVSP